MYWKRNLVLAWLMAMSSTVAALAASSPDRLKDNVLVGQGTATTKKITFDIGSGSANPAIQSTSTGVLQFAMDGVNFSTFGSGGGGGTGVNVLKNPGFEIGTANWTNAGSATFTTTASGANVGFDLAAGAWTPSATAATLTSDQYTVPAGMVGSVCSASLWYQGGSANVTLQVINGSSTVLASKVLSAQTTYVQSADVRFACPSSGTFALQLVSTGSSATAYLDNAFLGQAPRRPVEDRNENLVANGNAEDALNPTNWTTYNDGASAALLTGTGGTASGLAAAAISSTSPIGGSRSWLFSKTGASSAQGQGWSYQFTVNANSQYQNALNDLAFDYHFDSGGAANADTVRVYLYDVTNSAVITPTFVTCGGGSTPSLAAVTTTCHAELGWLASAAGTTYRLGFHVAGTTTSAFALTVDNLFVGQHRVTVGPQTGPDVAFTPTPANFGTITNVVATYKRMGDRMLIKASWVDGTLAAAAASLPLPAGYTIDSTRLSSSGVLGSYWGINTASGGISGNSGELFYDGSDTSNIYFASIGGNTTWSKMNASAIGQSGTLLNIVADVPIAQWAGGSAFGENKCEYAYNSGNVTAAGGSDTTSFGYGPAGATFLGYGSNTANSSTNFTAQFTTPVSQTDQLALEVFNAGRDWTTPVDAGIGQQQQGTCEYGVGLVGSLASGQVTVAFGNCGYQSTATFGSGGGAWSSLSSWKWRVKKCKAGIPTAFGLANSSTPGLESYEDSGTFTASFTGARTTSDTFAYARSAKVVSIRFPQDNGVSCAASSFTTGAGAIPAALRPLDRLRFPVWVQDNAASLSTPGELDILTDGTINITKSLPSAAFTAAANCGWFAGTISYQVN